MSDTMSNNLNPDQRIIDASDEMSTENTEMNNHPEVAENLDSVENYTSEETAVNQPDSSDVIDTVFETAASPGYSTVDENDDFEFVKSVRSHERAHTAKEPHMHRKDHSNSGSYITRKFYVLSLIVVMIFTAAVSTAASVLIVRNTSGSQRSYSNLTSSSIDKSSGSQLSTQEIIAKNIDAVVEINTASVSTNMFGQQSISEGAGSGVIVNKDGYIATNNHVIDGAKTISVTLHNGSSYTAKLVGTDPENDIAVIKISASNLTVAELGDSSKLSVGDQTVAIGNPLGSLGGTATTGIISALERRLTINDTTLDLLQTDSAINPGNSGGGLFNGAGELIGIVVAKSSGTGIEGLGFAIPINSVADIIDSLIDNGVAPDKAYVGITIRDIDSDYAEYYHLDGAGVYIVNVTSDEADKAGLRSGDKIISINGKKVSNSSDFKARVHENEVGDTVTIVISRDGKEKEIKVTLTSEADNVSPEGSADGGQQDSEQGF